ncbi:MAG: hypothetical protein AAB588_02945 [Patescibacteria group bacterium]
MALLQVHIDEKLKKALRKKAEMYDVPVTSLVRIVLVKSFMEDEERKGKPGNVFNAERDNKGKGLPIDDLIGLL